MSRLPDEDEIPSILGGLYSYMHGGNIVAAWIFRAVERARADECTLPASVKERNELLQRMNDIQELASWWRQVCEELPSRNTSH